jgi:hypothetical protein
MTEAEWLAATDPREMLLFMHGRTRDRKACLFACACCRRFWQAAQPAAQSAIELGEWYADKPRTFDAVTRRKFREGLSLRDGIELTTATAEERISVAAANTLRKGGAALASIWAEMSLGDDPDSPERNNEVAAQVLLARDIFGNPFRSVAFDTDWRTSTAVSLAKQMYASREFSLMPILSDALQDAGCDNADILDHCRSDGPHVRGCWVVDHLLEKQ